MAAVTVSHQYQVVIPSRIRRRLGGEPGQKVKVIPCDNRVRVVLAKPVEQARGFLRGISTAVGRESYRL